MEPELNALIFGVLLKALSGEPEPERLIRLRDRPEDVMKPVSRQSLGSLNRLLKHAGTARTAHKRGLGRDGKWLMDELLYQLKSINEMRNPANHADSVGRERLRHQRARFLGTGCQGLLVRVLKGKAANNENVQIPSGNPCKRLAD